MHLTTCYLLTAFMALPIAHTRALIRQEYLDLSCTQTTRIEIIQKEEVIQLFKSEGFTSQPSPCKGIMSDEKLYETWRLVDMSFTPETSRTLSPGVQYGHAVFSNSSICKGVPDRMEAGYFNHPSPFFSRGNVTSCDRVKGELNVSWASNSNRSFSTQCIQKTCWDSYQFYCFTDSPMPSTQIPINAGDSLSVTSSASSLTYGWLTCCIVGLLALCCCNLVFISIFDQFDMVSHDHVSGTV